MSLKNACLQPWNPEGHEIGDDIAMSTLCVYCGSNTGTPASFMEAAAEVGREIGQAGHRLVYGGCAVGLMGAVADAALQHGAEVVGIMPRTIAEMGRVHEGLTDLRIVDSMHTRKALMAELSDCFLALPGGVGTLEELAEIFVWMQIGVHTKPCGILNVSGFYDPLLHQLATMVQSGFLRKEQLEQLIVLHHPSEICLNLIGKQSRSYAKWLQ